MTANAELAYLSPRQKGTLPLLFIKLTYTLKTQTYPMRHHTSTIVFILLLSVITVIALTSCESKSGKLNSTPVEKVVVIDSYRLTPKSGVENNMQYKYKVRRINHGVVTTIYDQNLYEKGDTIYKRIYAL